MKKTKPTTHPANKFCQDVWLWFGLTKTTIGIIIIFIVHAGWIAWSAVFPMAFDEEYHLGLIKFYSSRWWPFMSGQPVNLDQYGGVWRDPSYLYHYAMSWPWRLITHLTNNERLQIILLRFVSVGLVAFGIWLVARLLQKANFLPQVRNLLVLAVALTPLLPLLAAQINYDSATFLLAAACSLLAFQFDQALTESKIVDIYKLATFLILGLLASLVKYAFLPVFAGLSIWLVFRLLQSKLTRTQLTRVAHQSWVSLGKRRKIVLVFVGVLSISLFSQRYIVNVVSYHTPTPECDQVLNVARCQAYSPWKRNYDYAQSKPTGFTPNPIRYTYIWLRHMAENLTFSVSGPSGGFNVGDPLLLMIILIVGVGLPGTALTLLLSWRLRKNAVFQLAWLVTGIYMLTLWLQNYLDYSHVGQYVAIQGRYLLPVLPLIFIAWTLAYLEFFKNHRWVPKTLGIFIAVCLILSGGALTFVLRSDERWYWPDRTVKQFNSQLQHDLGFLKLGSPPKKATF